MIQSKHKTLGFWLIASALLFFILSVIFQISQHYFNFIIIKFFIPNQRTFYAFMIIDVIAIFILGGILWSNGNIILIDNGLTEKSISFKNIISRRIKTYYFEELDGYIDTLIAHESITTTFKTICLIKDGIVVKKN